MAARHGMTPSLRRLDGSHWWALCTPTVRSRSGAGADCLEFVLDVTKQRRSAHALHELNSRLELPVWAC